MAQQAAHAAAAHQTYPAGALYVLATPIGNLADISLRALYVLQLVDAIACEDTRHTQAMLRSYGLERPANQLLAVHQHNEAEAAQTIAARLQQGQRIAYVSDAGTPGISDPGARLCAALHTQGLRCIPMPGPSSITSAISVAGCLPTQEQQHGFVFQGFLPTKSMERQAVIQAIQYDPRCIVLLEAPHRIANLAQALASLGERPLTLAREISKQFEQITTLPAQDAAAWLQTDAQRCKGEFVIVLHPYTSPQSSSTVKNTQILQLLLAELPTKTAVKLCAEITGANRNALYEQALQLRAATQKS